MNLEKPYLVFLGDAYDELAAKTAFGVSHWCPEDCVGQIRLPGCVPSLDLPSLTVREAVDKGAKTMVVGVANRGGFIPDTWVDTMTEALNEGMSLANGLHTPLDSIAEVREAASKAAGEIIEVRHPPDDLPIGAGKNRSGKRLLTVGTDCSVGKMYSALSIAREMQKRDMKCDFRATGQTGIFIAGSGISVDAVVADFIAGAVEVLTPDADDDHWDIVEGQGSLHHPSYSGVSLGLLHGAQPDALVLCHEPTRTHMRGLPHRTITEIQDSIDINLETARIMRPDVVFVGISVNTKHLEPAERDAYLSELEDRYELPSVDPFAVGSAPIVDRIQSIF